MIEALGLLGHGFLDYLTPINIFCTMIGCLLGSLIGVSPGLRIPGTVAVLLFVTFGMQPLSALIVILGIYFGSQYGGTITSILVNIPGEAASIVTCSDGHPLAKQGKRGKILSVVAISSFCGGVTGLVGLIFAALAPAEVALSLGKVEFFAIMALGLVPLTITPRKDQLKGLIVVYLGVILSCMGLDDPYRILRFAHGVVDLYKGISFVTFIMSVYGTTELMSTICIPENQGKVADFNPREQFPSKEDFGQIYKTIGRYDITGFGVGLAPGAGSTLATSFAYRTERSLSKHLDAFGTGLLEGVVVPGATNNAAIYTDMVPLLSLSIPFTSSMTLLMGAFIVHGIAPGPMFISEYPDLFWGLTASMPIGSIVLLIISLPLVGIWAGLLKVDFIILVPLIIFITFVDGYAINNSVFDTGVIVTCDISESLLSACGYNMTALAVELFLSLTLENSPLDTVTPYKGSLLAALIDHPIAVVIFSTAMIALVYSTAESLIQFFGKRKAANQEEA